jgi:sugar lactone lactonase YvrE
MVFRKAIIQVYSGNEPFGFDDFVKGTLRLLNYAIDHNIDVKINVSGSEFEPYMIVNNYTYDKINVKPRFYYMQSDQQTLITDLDAFIASSEPIFVVTSNVWFDRNDIYNLSYVGFDTLVRYRESLYTAAEQKVKDNLLFRKNPDGLLYGYSLIYVHRDEFQYIIKTRDLASLANQIRRSLDMNKDIMVFSNSIQFRTILSQYIEMNSGAVQKVDDSIVDIGPIESIPNIEDLMVDFIILLKAKKIYKFSDFTQKTGHNIKFIDAYKLQNQGLFTNVYDTAFDINSIVGNLEMTLIPLYYQTTSLAVDTSGNTPSGVVIDTSGNIYMSDTQNHRIRKLDVSGNLTVIAGTGVPGYTNGPSSTAQFNGPTALAIDIEGNIYVADTNNNAIRILPRMYQRDASGTVVSNHSIVGTVAGGGPETTSSGIGSGLLLNRPRGVAVDSSGCVYISDTSNHRICKIVSGGSLTTLAGSASFNGPLVYSYGFINGEGTEASFNGPTALCVDLKGNIFVTDTNNNAIRRVTPSGKVTTVAGSGQQFYKEGRRHQASFNKPVGICVDLYNVLYVTDTGNNMVRRITNEGNVIPVVGSPVQKSGTVDGYGSIDPKRSLVPFEKRATFNSPVAICVGPSRILYVADSLNNRIRKITPTFSTPTDIKPVAMQSLRVTHAPGVAYTLGPTLSAPDPPPNTIIYGHKRGTYNR